jgi:hypothetical protein
VWRGWNRDGSLKGQGTFEKGVFVGKTGEKSPVEAPVK